jgi:putative CGCGG family rSAM target protein
VFGVCTTVVGLHRVGVRSEAVHDGSWSKNLETRAYADDVDRLVADAVSAVEAIRPGVHVNLVTHASHGHPHEVPYDELAARVGERTDVESVERCGCGGRVTRITVGDDTEQE